MRLLNKLLGRLIKRKTSGIFIPDKIRFSEYKGDIGDNSINSIASSLGYNPDQKYSILNFSQSEHKITTIVCELFTINILFVLTDNNVNQVTQKDVDNYLVNFSYFKEFSRIRIDDKLNNGIENRTLTVDFLARVLDLKNTSSNGMFYSEKIKTYLYFTEGLLTGFQYDDGFFTWAKYLQEVNITVYSWISQTAYKYWPDNDFQAKKEINIQCEAWSRIPDAFGNEFIPLHQTENGGANLHMIRVCHYDHPITLSQFKEINHGRYNIVSELCSLQYIGLSCGRFIYLFDVGSEELVMHKQVIFI